MPPIARPDQSGAYAPAARLASTRPPFRFRYKAHGSCYRERHASNYIY